jgi:signal transduction histidine kinase
MFLRSLYGQMVAVLFVLLATLLTQLILSRDYLSTLANNQELISTYSQNVGQVIELERDVIELQRQLLSYNETASDSTIQQFNSAMSRVEDTLANLSAENIDSQEITRMAAHLKDYQENFLSVVEGRSNQTSLIQNINKNLKSILHDNKKRFTETSLTWLQIKVHIYSMDRAMFEYLNSSDAEFISEFKNDVVEVKKLLAKVKSNVPLIKKINSISKQFVRLTQVRRGYIFLVKVVMAGSANEFLYIAKKIKKDALNNQKVKVLEAKQSASDIKHNNNVITVSSFFIILIIALFLSRRILNPVKRITQVFVALSRGYEVEKIPSIDRKDEIGELAKAAKVFHEKNKQTHTLLEQSQDMIANQEVMNIQLEKEKEKAENAAKSKSMFLANMSHEIRTPMNGIVGLVDLVMKSKLDEQQKNYLEKIAYSGQIMMNVINDILDFSKIEAGKLEIESTEYSIESIIDNLISAVTVRIDEKKLLFKVNVSENVPERIQGDPLRVSQILLNLCNNSIKFTDKGLIEVYFDYKTTEQELLISVHDTGIGMTEQQIENIFSSFTQADGSTSRKYGGTGLGLSIVKQLVLLMQGEINVESTPGEGASVHLSIKTKSLSNVNILSLHTLGKRSINLLSDESLTVSTANTTLSNLGMLSKTWGTETDNTHPVLIETNDLEFIKTLKDRVSNAIKEGKEVGFMVAHCKKDILEFIKSQWQLDALTYPFSPNECIAYLSSLYGLKYDATEQGGNAEDEGMKPLYGHVLLVEDNKINQLVAGDMLESIGLSFDVAEDGLQALSVVKNNAAAYDLIFMDVQMPNMDGYEATKAIRELGFDDLIICGLSANALKEDLERADAAGMTDYLTKPLVIDKLYDVAKKYLT